MILMGRVQVEIHGEEDDGIIGIVRHHLNRDPAVNRLQKLTPGDGGAEVVVIVIEVDREDVLINIVRVQSRGNGCIKY